MKLFPRVFTYVVMLILLASCSSTGSKKKVDEARIHYQLGVSYLNEGNRIGALQELLQALKISPADKDIRNALGLAYLSLDDFKEAIIHFKKSVEIDPEFSEAHNNLGVTYLRLEEYDNAISAFESATSNVLYATPEMALNNIGWAHYKKGDLEKAMEYYGRALKFAPDFPMARYNKGLIYFDRKKYKDAEYEFKRLIKDFPGFAEARMKLALTYLKLEKKSLALKEFEEVVKNSADETLKKEADRYFNMLK